MPFGREWQDAANETGRELGISHLCCPNGCYPCGTSYYQTGEHHYDCCRETICNEYAWGKQLAAYLTIEEKFNVALWLEVEKEFKAKLAERPKVRVRYEGRQPAGKEVHQHVVARPQR